MNSTQQNRFDFEWSRNMKRTLLNIQCRLYPFNWNLKNGLHFHSTRIAYRVPNACILMSKYPSHKMIRLSFWKNKWRGIECATEWKASERIVIGYVMNKWCTPHTERDGIGSTCTIHEMRACGVWKVLEHPPKICERIFDPHPNSICVPVRHAHNR